LIRMETASPVGRRTLALFAGRAGVRSSWQSRHTLSAAPAPAAPKRASPRARPASVASPRSTVLRV
jgi:hypothetical protein